MFISLEGADYSGKTSMSLIMKEYFESMGKTVTLTKEPGGTAMGTKIREILINEDVINDPLEPTTQAMLLTAARVHHIKTVIIPALIHGHVVISDRFIDSTHVYQGLLFKKKEFIKQLLAIKEFNFLNVRPDYTFFFDINFDTMLERMNKRSDSNALDKKYAALKEAPIDCFKQHFYELNHKGYERIKIIDANQDMDTVKETVLAVSSRCHMLHTTYVHRTPIDQHQTYIKKVLKLI
jgi:dTMP kinase